STSHPEVRSHQEVEEPETGQLDVPKRKVEISSPTSRKLFGQEKREPSGVVDLPPLPSMASEKVKASEEADRVMEDEDFPPLPEGEDSTKSKNLSGNLSAMGLADL